LTARWKLVMFSASYVKFSTKTSLIARRSRAGNAGP
jgi:hypothetical protein